MVYKIASLEEIAKFLDQQAAEAMKKERATITRFHKERLRGEAYAYAASASLLRQTQLIGH